MDLFQALHHCRGGILSGELTMETEPVYHLEGIVKSKDEAQDFDGPLNLILMLLSKNKIEIRDIQISLILDQYLEYVEHMKEENLEVASEFVQMASQLLYIKTRMLLTGEEEITELEQLMTSLEQLKCRDIYASVRGIVPDLGHAAERGILMFSTPGEPAPKYREYDYRHECFELLEAFRNMLTRGKTKALENETQDMLRAVPKRIIYGVRQKSRELINLLRSAGEMPLSRLYSMSHSRSEIVAVFLSVLELCSHGTLAVATGDNDESVITFIGGDTETVLNSIDENLDLDEQDITDAG